MRIHSTVLSQTFEQTGLRKYRKRTERGPDQDLYWISHPAVFTITKTRLFKYIENFTTKKKKKKKKREKFQLKNSCSLHISAQNIDCGYPLETPRRGGSNEYPQFMF